MRPFVRDDGGDHRPEEDQARAVGRQIHHDETSRGQRNRAQGNDDAQEDDRDALGGEIRPRAEGDPANLNPAEGDHLMRRSSHATNLGTTIGGAKNA